MSVLTDSFQAVVPATQNNNAGPELTHTRWGYMITSRDAAGLAMRAGYLLMRMTGIVLLLAAVGLWILPGTSVHGDVMPFKLAISVLFSILGGVAIWTSTNDRRDETQVDFERQELRRGVRHANGRFAVVSELALCDAGDLFVSRPAYEGDDAVLYLRRANSALALELAAGPEDLLFPLQKRITADLSRVELAA